MCALKKIVVIRQFLHLSGRRIDEFLAVVTHVDAPQAGHTVQDFVAIRIVDVNAFSAGNDARATLFSHFLVIGERMHMMALITGFPVSRFIQ